MIDRRGFLNGIITTIAAPAIVRIDNIMPVRRVSISLITIDMVTREMVYLFKNTNYFLQYINDEFVIKQISDDELYLNV